jgi:hypothetical protein
LTENKLRALALDRRYSQMLQIAIIKRHLLKGVPQIEPNWKSKRIRSVCYLMYSINDLGIGNHGLADLPIFWFSCSQRLLTLFDFSIFRL